MNRSGGKIPEVFIETAVGRVSKDIATRLKPGSSHLWVS